MFASVCSYMHASCLLCACEFAHPLRRMHASMCAYLLAGVRTLQVCLSLLPALLLARGPTSTCTSMLHARCFIHGVACACTHSCTLLPWHACGHAYMCMHPVHRVRENLHTHSGACMRRMHEVTHARAHTHIPTAGAQADFSFGQLPPWSPPRTIGSSNRLSRGLESRSACGKQCLHARGCPKRQPSGAFRQLQP